MVYKYTFLNNNYINIEDFAVGLSNNYGDAINYIFTDQFINQIDDYYLRGRIQTEMRRCKYAESVFTMVVYLLNPSLGLCVRGRFFKSLEELAEYMHVTSTNKDLSVLHLFLDNCITHTLGASADFSQEFKDNIVYIEDNINDPAIYEYFIDLFNIKFERTDAHGLSVFDYYLSTISTSKSRLDSYLALINDPGFKSALFKKFGLKQILEIYASKNAPFMIIKLIDEHTQLDIVQFLDMGITNWLLKNYKHYKFSFDTRKLKALFKECAKESKNVMSVDERIKFNEKVYTYYRNFLNLYDCQKIKEESEEYRLDIYYNKNRGCIKYYQDLGLSFDYSQYKINLQTYNKDNVKIIMKHSFDEINNYNNDLSTVDANRKLLPINYKRTINSKISNSNLLLLVSLAALVFIGYLGLVKSNLFGTIQYIVSFSLSLGLLFFTFINLIYLNKSKKVLCNEFLSRDEEYYYQAKEQKSLGYKKAYRNNTILHILETTLFASVLGFITYASCFFIFNKVVSSYMFAIYGLLGLGFVFGIITRKKPLLDLLLILLAPIVIILLFIM